MFILQVYTCPDERNSLEINCNNFILVFFSFFSFQSRHKNSFQSYQAKIAVRIIEANSKMPVTGLYNFEVI